MLVAMYSRMSRWRSGCPSAASRKVRPRAANLLEPGVDGAVSVIEDFLGKLQAGAIKLDSLFSKLRMRSSCRTPRAAASAARCGPAAIGNDKSPSVLCEFQLAALHHEFLFDFSGSNLCS